MGDEQQEYRCLEFNDIITMYAASFLLAILIIAWPCLRTIGQLCHLDNQVKKGPKALRRAIRALERTNLYANHFQLDPSISKPYPNHYTSQIEFDHSASISQSSRRLESKIPKSSSSSRIKVRNRSPKQMSESNNSTTTSKAKTNSNKIKRSKQVHSNKQQIVKSKKNPKKTPKPKKKLISAKKNKNVKFNSRFSDTESIFSMNQDSSKIL
ncbi:hypothetical protein BLOT_007962 [Blomia tropicalis]|nr:hypothetical protein BLOT_007962 [Blomia tropicalis]